MMTEINRQLAVTLNRENNMYYILNDLNYVCKFYAADEEKANIIFEAWLKGGIREKYAVEKGVFEPNPKGYADCIRFDIPDEPASDSNGALYHIKRKEWVN